MWENGLKHGLVALPVAGPATSQCGCMFCLFWIVILHPIVSAFEVPKKTDPRTLLWVLGDESIPQKRTGNTENGRDHDLAVLGRVRKKPAIHASWTARPSVFATNTAEVVFW